MPSPPLVARAAPALIVLTLALAARLAVAGTWGLLADEAYHWRWSQLPAFGYFDQPPLIAWVLAIADAWMGRAPWALRALPIGVSLAGVAALLPYGRDRALLAVWGATLPPLWLLGQLAVPDALLLGGWGIGLAGALAGGPAGWCVAGLGGGLAGLAKPTGWLLLPLLVAFAPARERRTPWPWVGAALAVVLIAPNLWFQLQHHAVMLDFQISEGLLSPRAPGWRGPLQQLGDQLLFATPVAAAAGAIWWGSRAPWRTPDRRDRLIWGASAPLLLGFAAAAVGGPPEAHWPAPAWLAVGVGLARAGPDLRRVAWIGAAVGVVATVAILAQSGVRILDLSPDPGIRPWEGAVLAAGVSRSDSASSTGGAKGCDRVPVLTERYQEAAFVAYGTDRTARTVPGCGRDNQDDLWRAPLPVEALFVRPARSGPPTCLEGHYRVVELVDRVQGTDPAGRRVGPWDVFRVAEPP